MTAHFDPLADLAQRRDGLAAQIESERDELARAAFALGRRAGQAQLHDVNPLIRRYGPLLLPVAVFLLLNPKRSVRWALALWGIWRMVQQAGLSEELVAHASALLARRHAP